VFDPPLGLGDEQSINEADTVFICVPTPYRDVVGFDDAALHAAIETLSEGKTVVIKSTVLPGTTEALQARYSQHCFLFNPEFLREGHARTDFLRPDRQIVGYTAQSRHLAEKLLAMLPSAPYRSIMVAREAEMAKYMTNTFLALKVTFANEMYDLAETLEIDYKVVRDAVAADPRIGGSHFDVFADGMRGYGGKCIPKDTKALLDLSERLGSPLRLLRTADRVNSALVREDERDVSSPPTIVPVEFREAADIDERAA
jgi:UDPglucose 6-dehydrogenase